MFTRTVVACSLAAASGSSSEASLGWECCQLKSLAISVTTAASGSSSAASLGLSPLLRRVDQLSAVMQRLADAVDTTAGDRSVPRVLLRRLPASARRLVSGLQQTWDSPADSSSSSSSIMSTGSSVTAAGVWAPRTTNSSSSTNGNSSSSEHDRTQSYNMDIDFD
ncbi:unnamed protein product [Plutella xylostella]|uniref:(diamondback moth) hypothetical protein n=1 Tax=Plutella xylostella TaxID=51655 RepID=A0A8S4FN70_PLUXY|nr:unnamed protein product [Plutella xylostella]